MGNVCALCLFMDKIKVQIPSELAPYLVGLWRFRQVARKPTWCTTFTVDGAFYDTTGALTAQKAIDKAVRELRRVK